jgi:hypothetical protein
MSFRCFRRVIYKKKTKFLTTNPKPSIKNYIYFFPKKTKAIVSKKQYDKLIMFLK